MGQSLEGQFLVAASHLRDPNFYRSVVLMLEHNDEAAMGLIVNRPMSTRLHDALASVGVSVDDMSPMFRGGPVESQSIFVMHNCGDLAAEDRRILDGVYVSGTDKSVESLMADESASTVDSSRCFRIYCGYAGWGPDQLEQEIQRGDWLVVPASSLLVFEHDPYDLWNHCRDLYRAAHQLFPEPPTDPRLN